MEAYEILSVIGEGTYGVVIKARHRVTGQLVAIKKFKQAEDDQHVRKTSMREVRVLKHLHHLNIVSLLDVFRCEGKLYLVFEYIENTILQLLEASSHGLPPEDVRRYLYQLLRGVDYCHAHNIIHRDVKPENILVSRDDVVKLCDFGFARSLTSKGKYTDYVATRWYRAPELLVGDVAYTQAVDVWAIGCILSELSDSQPLFPGNSDLDQLHLILQSCGPLPPRMVDIFDRNPYYRRVKFPRPSLFRPLSQRFAKQPAEWLQLLLLCLRPDPAERPSCAELMNLPYFTKNDFRTTYELELRGLAPATLSPCVPSIRASHDGGYATPSLPALPTTPAKDLRHHGGDKSASGLRDHCRGLSARGTPQARAAREADVTAKAEDGTTGPGGAAAAIETGGYPPPLSPRPSLTLPEITNTYPAMSPLRKSRAEGGGGPARRPEDATPYQHSSPRFAEPAVRTNISTQLPLLTGRLSQQQHQRRGGSSSGRATQLPSPSPAVSASPPLNVLPSSQLPSLDARSSRGSFSSSRHGDVVADKPLAKSDTPKAQRSPLAQPPPPPATHPSALLTSPPPAAEAWRGCLEAVTTSSSVAAEQLVALVTTEAVQPQPPRSFVASCQGSATRSARAASDGSLTDMKDILTWPSAPVQRVEPRTTDDPSPKDCSVDLTVGATAQVAPSGVEELGVSAARATSATPDQGTTKPSTVYQLDEDLSHRSSLAAQEALTVLGCIPRPLVNPEELRQRRRRLHLTKPAQRTHGDEPGHLWSGMGPTTQRLAKPSNVIRPNPVTHEVSRRVAQDAPRHTKEQHHQLGGLRGHVPKRREDLLGAPLKKPRSFYNFPSGDSRWTQRTARVPAPMHKRPAGKLNANRQLAKDGLGAKSKQQHVVNAKYSLIL